MYKISIYGSAMFKKLVCQWVKKKSITMHGNMNVTKTPQPLLVPTCERLRFTPT